MDLNILKLTKLKKNDDKDKVFFDKINSKLIMDINENKILENDDWIDQVLFTMKYIEKALLNPNKQIITEEEIIKVELIKKVTVESIKHLAKNTQLITKFDEEKDEVTPEKILNAYKEENFVTYENRFIYTLINLIDNFIIVRERDTNENAYKGKDFIKAKYEATTRINKRKITYNFDYNEESIAPHKKSDDAQEKINQIKSGLKTLKNTELYVLLVNKHATLVKPPLKMTNVLLKNVNFQYAVKLWNYLNDNFDQKSILEDQEQKYEEKGMTKTLVDEDLYLLYLIFENILKNLDHRGKMKSALESKKDKQDRDELFSDLIDKILETSPDMTEDEIHKIINERFLKIQNKRVISLEIIEKKFRERIEKFMTMAEQLKLK